MNLSDRHFREVPDSVKEGPWRTGPVTVARRSPVQGTQIVEIQTRTKRGAVTLDDDDADFLVRSDFFQRGHDVVNHLLVDCVALFRAVQVDSGHPLLGKLLQNYSRKVTTHFVSLLAS